MSRFALERLEQLERMALGVVVVDPGLDACDVGEQGNASIGCNPPADGLVRFTWTISPSGVLAEP